MFKGSRSTQLLRKDSPTPKVGTLSEQKKHGIKVKEGKNKYHTGFWT